MAVMAPAVSGKQGELSSEGNICCLINVAWVVLVCDQEVGVNVFAS